MQTNYNQPLWKLISPYYSFPQPICFNQSSTCLRKHKREKIVTFSCLIFILCITAYSTILPTLTQADRDFIAQHAPPQEISILLDQQVEELACITGECEN